MIMKLQMFYPGVIVLPYFQGIVVCQKTLYGQHSYANIVGPSIVLAIGPIRDALDPHMLFILHCFNLVWVNSKLFKRYE